MKESKQRPSVLSLFTGAGGLDLGLEAAGFDTRLCVEIDEDAQKTIRKNRNWNLAVPGDIHKHTPSALLELGGLTPRMIDVLAGGPPCQPFSKSGYWANGDSKRLKDPRSSTLSAYLDLVDVALPSVVLLENVRGLTFSGKDEGFRLIARGLERINAIRGTSYSPVVITLNAADFGIPQFRERVFLVAHRDGKQFRAPTPTHGSRPGLLRYTTAWDAIGDSLPANVEELRPTGKWASLLRSIPEGGNYLHHTARGNGTPLFGWRTKFWSFLLKLAKNKPSWTIQAQPGPATGPFHWDNRLLSVEELCRLQTFPSGYRIHGTRRSAQRQIGNAVPSALAEILGLEIRRQLLGHEVSQVLTLLPTQREPAPPARRLGRVPKEFIVELCGEHKDHPGPGKGPAAKRRKLKRLRA